MYRVDASTGDVVKRLFIPNDLSSPITDGTYVYLRAGTDLLRVDPATNAVDPVVGGAMPLAFGQSALWSIIGSDLVRLDPQTLEPAARWRVLPASIAAGPSIGMAVDADSVWIVIDGRTLLRVTPTE
jgi:hypothetical protein